MNKTMNSMVGDIRDAFAKNRSPVTQHISKHLSFYYEYAQAI